MALILVIGTTGTSTTTSSPCAVLVVCTTSANHLAVRINALTISRHKTATMDFSVPMWSRSATAFDDIQAAPTRHPARSSPRTHSQARDSRYGIGATSRASAPVAAQSRVAAPSCAITTARAILIKRATAPRSGFEDHWGTLISPNA